MATIALIPGAGDSGLSWSRVAAHLRERGHAPVAVDLPCADPAAGWNEYADAVVRAVGDAGDLVVVGHSLGGFTAPLVCARVPARLLILVAAMIPTPGERAAGYWPRSGYGDVDFDDDAFYHDVPAEAVALAKRAERAQADTPMHEPWPLAAWPDVRTRYLLCRKDRVFPADVTRRLVRTRLGIVPDEIDSGHCVYLAHPRELAERIHAYVVAA